MVGILLGDEVNKEFGVLVNKNFDGMMIEDLFCNGFSVQMLIDRTVGNTRKDFRRWVSKRISTDKASFIKNTETLIEQMDYLIAKNPETDIRLYSSLNYRDFDKAEKRFLHTLIDLQDEHKNVFYSRMNDSFISCLMKPACKVKRYWLLDVDGCKDEVQFNRVAAHLYECEIFFINPYETPHGFHIICESFNLNEHWNKINSDGIVTLKKDGLVLLRAIGEGGGILDGL